MKKILFFAFLAVTFMAQAQTITIGEGTGLSTQVPFDTYSNYSFTEQIYFADEIEFAGFITAVSFRIAYSYNNESTTDINVYLKNVSKSSFADVSDFEPVNEENLVFSGLWTIPANTDDWLTINFDSPFYYNGTDNLMIAIDENSADYAIRYFKYTEVNGATLSYVSDDVNPNPYDLGSFVGTKTVVNQRANTKIKFSSNVGVDEAEVEMMGVYPNPAHGAIHLDVPEGETVSVYDAMGRLVMQEVYIGQLNISSLNSGIYAVATGKRLVKFVKK